MFESCSECYRSSAGGSKPVLILLATALSFTIGARAAAPSESSPTQVNACSLLTATEVSDALEVEVDDGERNDDGVTSEGAYSSTCLWRVPIGSDHESDPRRPLGGTGFAILNVISWQSGEDAGKFLQAFRDAAENGVIPREPVPLKLGDDALWWGDGVAVRKGSISFGISVVTQTADRSTLKSVEGLLARKILKRL